MNVTKFFEKGKQSFLLCSSSDTLCQNLRQALYHFLWRSTYKTYNEDQECNRGSDGPKGGVTFWKIPPFCGKIEKCPEILAP